ncbi:hypothetical protein BAC3_00504 [uncultured bacterium]|nr:hypothetical protein BAC3_00504 [uncultured bacterium]
MKKVLFRGPDDEDNTPDPPGDDGHITGDGIDLGEDWDDNAPDPDDE